MTPWSKIEAECGDFRKGFVAVFRKYEGQETDERDGSNRIVKVTMDSFARHMGIPRTTFQKWVAKVPPDTGVTTAAKDQKSIDDRFAEVTAGLVLDIDENTDVDERLLTARELAREGLSFQKIANAVGLNESTVRRDMAVRQAKAAVDPSFDIAGESVKHYDRTIACDLPSANDAIEEIDMLLDRMAVVYTLSKKDRAKLLKVLTAHLERLGTL